MMVGAGGLEPPASASRTLRANLLRYAPVTTIISVFGRLSKED